MTATGTWFRLLDQMRAYRDFDHADRDLLTAYILTGREMTFFGKPCRLRIEWLDGQPMTDEQITACGEAMRASALEALERIAS